MNLNEQITLESSAALFGIPVRFDPVLTQFAIDDTIETLAYNMFLETWINDTSYEKFFDACAPKESSCCISIHHVSLSQLLNEFEVSLLLLDSLYISKYLIHLISIGLTILVGKRLVSYEIRSLTTSVELCLTCEWVITSLDRFGGGEGRNVQLNDRL
ncbi:unnamed protein product, partial [Rotaria sp. Silwood1]